MNYTAQFTPEAIDHLTAVRAYLATAASPHVADHFTTQIFDYCEGLAVLPHGGHPRDDLRPGLRTSSYTKRVLIAYVVDDTTRTLTILGIFYGGQDYETLLTDNLTHDT